jgi:hypothetical protein
MADRYWRGGTGTWNATTTNWSDTSGGAGGFSAPTANDDVYIDANSNTGTAAFTITVGATTNCRSISFNADGLCTLARGTNNMNINGSWYNSTSATFATTGTGGIQFVNNAGLNGGDINTNGVSWATNSLVFNGVGATWTLQSAISTSAAGFTTHTNGAINLNGFTFTSGTYTSTTNNAGRYVTFGSARILVNSTSLASNSIQITGNGWSCDCSTSGLSGGFQRAAAATTTITVGSNFDTAAEVTPDRAPNIYIVSGGSVPTFAIYCTLNNLDFTGSTCSPSQTSSYSTTTRAGTVGVLIGGDLTFASGGTYTNFNFSFYQTDGRLQSFNAASKTGLRSWSQMTGSGTVRMLSTAAQATSGSIYNLVSGTFDLNGFNVTLCTFNSGINGTSSRTVAMGAANIYLNAITAGAVNMNVVNATNMSVTQTTGIFDKINSVATTIAYGNSVAPSYTTVGLPNFSSNAMTTANLTIASGSYFKNLNFNGFTSGQVASTTINMIGNLTHGADGVSNPTANVDFNFLGQGLVGEPYGVIKATWTNYAKKIGNLYMNAPGNGAITLQGNGLQIGNFILQEGYFSTNNTTGVRMNSFNANYALYPGSQRALDIGNSNVLISDSTTSKVLFDTGGGSNLVPGQTCGVFSSSSGNTAGGGTISIGTLAASQSILLGTNTNGIASNSLPKIYFYTGSFPLTFGTDQGQIETFNNSSVTQDVNGNISVYHDVVLNSFGVSTQYANLSMSIRGRSGRTCNVTPSNKTLANIWIDGTTLNTGGNTVLLANLSCNNFTFNSGNLIIGNITANSWISNTSSIRTLRFGNAGGQIAVATNNTTVFDQNGANLTLAGNTYYVRLGYASTVGTRTVILSGYSDSNIAPAITTSGTSGIVLNTSATDILAVQGTAGDITLTSYGGTLNTGTGLTMYGNLTLGNTTNTSNVANAVTFASTANNRTITTNGRTVNFPLTFNGFGGVWTFQDALTMLGTRTLTMANGTVKLKSSATSTVGDFVTTGSTLKFLQSSTNGTQATISKSSGTVDVTYLSIKDSAATGGAVWLANAATNVDAGNNSGWFFTTPPTPTSTGNMFIVFH